MLNKIVTAANVRITDLLYLNRFMHGYRNKLCYNHILGTTPITNRVGLIPNMPSKEM